MAVLKRKQNEELSRKQVIKILWNKGILEWKLDDLQKKIYHQFYDDTDDITTMLISRQNGKSYLLSILAIEACLRKPDAVVKFVTPKLKMVKNILNKNMKVILKDCPPDLMPEWKEGEKVWRFKNGSEIQAAGSDNQNYDNVRGGTCSAKHTKILTKSGIKEIKDIQKGDILYGYNEDGTISETKVLVNKYMGKQIVTDLYNSGKCVGAFTEDHPFLTNSISSVYRNDPKNVEKRFADINPKNTYIVRNFVECSGDINEPHAYAIGAFIGDGCKPIGNQLRISSKDRRVPDKVAETIGCKIKPSGDFLFYLSHETERYKQTEPVNFNYYNEWLRDFGYLNKNFDFDIVNTWNRESCLKLLAGLHDTDGNLYVGDGHCDFEYTSCNLDLIKNINKLILKLFQTEGHIKEDNRSEIPCYKLKISSVLHVSRIVKELVPYVALKYKVDINKKYKQKENEKAVRVTKGDSYEEDTYDIIIDNDSGFYLTAHGLVTHNCDLWIVDEAGFCNDLEEVVYSVLIPTTTMTGGTGILSSTPDPKDPEHPFITLFVEPADLDGRLFKYTIDDNVRLDEAEIKRIIKRYPGGRDHPRFRAEYLCEIIRDSETTVIPEFDTEAEKSIVNGEYERPKYFDVYLAMDIGGKDFTVVLFAYFDFAKNTVVVEDEYVLRRKQNSKELAEGIKAKLAELYGEKQPYLMFADNNNIILLNDLQMSHSLNFLPTKKDNKEAAINNVRLKVLNREVIIHPRCKTLIYHLKNGKWAKRSKNASTSNYKQFAKSADGGHFDALDAIIYLIRNIVFSKNPYPSYYGALSPDNAYSREVEDKKYEFLGDLFKVRKSLKS